MRSDILLIEQAHTHQSPSLDTQGEERRPETLSIRKSLGTKVTIASFHLDKQSILSKDARNQNWGDFHIGLEFIIYMALKMYMFTHTFKCF
jgi:hypothetical protein